jgi:hypothetical protein
MICHIRMGKLPWCASPYAHREDLALVAKDFGLNLTCSHVSEEKAQRVVAFLHEHGIDTARVVPGPCPEQTTWA